MVVISEANKRKLEELLFSKEANDELTNQGMKIFNEISEVLIKEEVSANLAFVTLTAMAESILAYMLVNDDVDQLSYEDFHKFKK